MMALPSKIISAAPFVPHTLEHLTQVRAFPSPLPEAAYQKMLMEYDQLEGVTVSRIVYKSDGLMVTGIAALPTEMQAGAHPILIYNRGGSREYGKLTLLSALRSMVPFAKQGYLVFASNYRGNDGGEGHEEFGGIELNDVLNLLAIAREHPAFDSKNMFMLGHSRGGMMTTLAIKHGVALGAAISIAGISDAHSMVANHHVREEMLKKVVPGYNEDPDKALAERSAVLWPEVITVPLLLLHGDNDKDVEVEDSVRLEKAIKQAGGTTELVIYPGGSHALIRFWDDVLSRSVAWMERFRL